MSKTAKKKNKNFSKNKKISVNPAKTSNELKKTEKHSRLSEEKLNTDTSQKVFNAENLIKPDPSDKEATRNYYEALSIQKTKQGIHKKKQKQAVIEDGKVKKGHVQDNLFIRAYTAFRSGITKQLKTEDYKRIITGAFAVIIIAAFLIVPLVGLFNWYSMYSMGLNPW